MSLHTAKLIVQFRYSKFEAETLKFKHGNGKHTNPDTGETENKWMGVREQ